MKIFITGGTGLIGSRLVASLLEKNHQITVYTRNAVKAILKLGEKVEYCSSLDVPGLLEGYDAVINLAGESIGEGRWSDERKKRLIGSRVNTTQKLADLINNSNNRPSVFISGSATGYYGAQGDNILTEESSYHDEFTHELCKEWEARAMQAGSDATRVCILRTGVVLASEGGMLPKMSLPFKLGLGSILGKGSQYISWIHIDDMVNGIIFLLENANARGAFNMTSPKPVTNKVFSKNLARALHRPCLFKVPGFVISTVMGEASTLVLDGQRVIPQKLKNLGFRFLFEDIDKALDDVFKE